MEQQISDSYAFEIGKPRYNNASARRATLKELMRKRDERQRSRNQSVIAPLQTEIDSFGQSSQGGKITILKPSPSRNYTKLVDTSVVVGTLSKNMVGMTYKYSSTKADRNRSIGRLFPCYGIADPNV